MPHLLLNKFLITGANSINPRPRTAFNSVPDAIKQAEGFLGGSGRTDAAAIIWQPCHLVSLQPVFSVTELAAPSIFVDRRAIILHKMKELLSELSKY